MSLDGGNSLTTPAKAKSSKCKFIQKLIKNMVIEKKDPTSVPKQVMF